MPAYDKADIERRMNGAVESLKSDLAGLRTGRANTSLLDPIQVEDYGANMPLNQVATVTVPEPRMLSVQVWDKSMALAVDKAIRESSLGLNPQTEGQVIRIRIPELNEQRRKEMVKVAHKYAEEARVVKLFDLCAVDGGAAVPFGQRVGIVIAHDLKVGDFPPCSLH